MTKQPLEGFERRLLDTLTDIDARRPATARATVTVARPAWARPSLVAASGTAVLAVSVALVSGALRTPDALTEGGTNPGGGSAPPIAVEPAAFTVKVNPDGSVTFTARDLVDPRAATRALNSAGVAGRVVNNTEGCPGIDKFPVWPPRPRPTDPPHEPPEFLSGSDTVTIRTSDYPRGGGVLVLVHLRQRPTGPMAVVAYWSYDRLREVPACVDNTD